MLMNDSVGFKIIVAPENGGIKRNLETRSATGDLANQAPELIDALTSNLGKIIFPRIEQPESAALKYLNRFPDEDHLFWKLRISDAGGDKFVTSLEAIYTAIATGNYNTAQELINQLNAQTQQLIQAKALPMETLATIPVTPRMLLGEEAPLLP